MSAAKFVFELSGFFGRPKSIRSDGGSQFANHIVEGLLKLMGINKHTSLAYRPQANGLVERCIKEVVKHLRYIILERRVQENWSTYLPMVQRIINATVHSGIGVAPAKLVFGGMVDMDRCLVPDKVPSVVLDGIELIKDNERRIAVAAYLDHLVQAQAIIVQRAQEHQDAMVNSRMGRYNPKAPESFEVGDWVLLQWEGGRRPTSCPLNGKDLISW
jgi:transposase InsO family protein